ncbi:MAG: OmpA family protein, partial [Bacteroidota bacterium]|nr:OmpA family protein [Bacteroidota bacterium]
TVTSDNKTIYFTSNRKGGTGGLDIYKTEKDTAGKWGPPVNLGEVINTTGNEKSPFIHPDKQTLYFSSDGHRGLGGYDIFISRMKKNKDKGSREKGIKWVKPVNIGYPINGEDDDLGFFVSTDGKTGYFSSTNTSEKYRSFGGWDLYHFSLYEGARPEKVLFLKGDLKGEDGKPIENAKMELTNVRTKEVTEVEVDAKMGKYATVITLEEEDDYIMNVTKENYAFTSKYISSKEAVEKVEEGKQTLDFDLEIKEVVVDEPYMIDNIQFASNSSSVLTVESMLILDGFTKYLITNNEMEVAIYGHTDAVGSDNDNLSLSENRARSVKDYLVLSGISTSRLAFKGFGESRPVATNDT